MKLFSRSGQIAAAPENVVNNPSGKSRGFSACRQQGVEQGLTPLQRERLQHAEARRREGDKLRVTVQLIKDTTPASALELAGDSGAITPAAAV